MRVAAGAVVRTLGAVTSGPVAAESLVLPEISRHSPLAPWKMLLRAIQALYANEDALCEKYLAAVEPTAAPARVVPAVRALMGQKQKLTPAAQELVKKAGGGFTELRTTLASLDQALEKNNQGFALQEIGRAVSLCKEVCPDQLERLKQHISVRAMMSGAKAERVTAAMGGPSLKNAGFWRLLARAYEEMPHDPLAIPMACSVWDEFRKHAVHEKWFPAKGPEVATLYLHMADLWRRIDDEQIERVVQRFAATFPGHGSLLRRPACRDTRADAVRAAGLLFPERGRAVRAGLRGRPVRGELSAMAQVGRAECAGSGRSGGGTMGRSAAARHSAAAAPDAIGRKHQCAEAGVQADGAGRATGRTQSPMCGGRGCDC